MKNKIAYITVGCSASGKSTWAREFKLENNNAEIIERDNIRTYIIKEKQIAGYYAEAYRYALSNMWDFWNFTWEKEVTNLFEIQLQDAINKNMTIVISDTNINKDKRIKLFNMLKSNGYHVKTVLVGQDLSLDELWARDAKRVNKVGKDVISKQYKQFREQYPKYAITNDKKLTPCVIVDIDGTLTLGPNNRSAFEWNKVNQDLPNRFLLFLLMNVRDTYSIIFVSGRNSICRDATLNWINKHYEIGKHNIKLYMRPEGDNRKDTIIKEELYNEHILNKYNVVAVFDDRPSVCRMWRDLGLSVYQLGDPHVEF